MSPGCLLWPTLKRRQFWCLGNWPFFQVLFALGASCFLGQPALPVSRPLHLRDHRLQKLRRLQRCVLAFGCSSESGRELEELLRSDVQEELGEYVIVSTSPVMVGPSKTPTPPPFLAELQKGQRVEVLEMETLPKEERLRGRIAQGWISLLNLGSGGLSAWRL